MFNLPNKKPDYLEDGLAKEKVNNNIQVYTYMLDEILDDYLDERITKNTMEDMMKWCCQMLEKAKGEKYG